MKYYGIVGWKNSGKTGLVERLVKYFSEQGLSVSTLKHAHHDFDIDHPGRDSFRHRMAGAREVLVTSDKRWALIHEQSTPTSPNFEQMRMRLSPTDLVLIEGFKNETHPKIEVSLKDTQKPLIAEKNKTVTALATNYSVSSSLPVMDIDDTQKIAHYILHEIDLKAGS